MSLDGAECIKIPNPLFQEPYGQIIFGIRLFFAIGVMYPVIFFNKHGLRHFFSHPCTMSVLERPHTLKIKKAYSVTLLKDVTQVRLQSRHRT